MVEPGVFGRDGEVTRNGLHQREVLAGEIVAVGGAAQAEHRDRPAVHAAGDEVVQIEIGDGAARCGRLLDPPARALEEEIGPAAVDRQRFEEAQVEPAPTVGTQRAGLDRPAAVVAQPEALGQPVARLGSARLAGQKDRHAAHIEGFDQPLPHGDQHALGIGRGTQLGREIDQRAAVVIALAVEAAVEALLDPVAQRMEQQRRRHHRDRPSSRGPDPRVAAGTRRSAGRPCRRTLPASVAVASV